MFPSAVILNREESFRDAVVALVDNGFGINRA